MSLEAIEKAEEQLKADLSVGGPFPEEYALEVIMALERAIERHIIEKLRRRADEMEGEFFDSGAPTELRNFADNLEKW